MLYYVGKQEDFKSQLEFVKTKVKKDLTFGNPTPDFTSCVDMDYKECGELISAVCPGLDVQYVEEGWMVTADYREDRVRVYYDATTSKVVDVPTVGNSSNSNAKKSLRSMSYESKTSSLAAMGEGRLQIPGLKVTCVTEFPECLILKKDMCQELLQGMLSPLFEFDFVEEGMMVTDDYVFSRIRIYYSPENDRVTTIPRIG